MTLLFLGFIGFILLVIIIFYLLKLCSITLFHIPGFDKVFQFIIIIIPYLLFFSAYRYLHKKIPDSTKKYSRFIGRTLLIVGSTVCFATLVISTLKFGGVRKEWINTFDDNLHYALIFQIIILFLCAAIIATGDAKEINWRDRP